jgi:poly-gamma-glutamate capsule biosynthesis protein CapA/YwtB (metallophosphatase superfamily)
VARTALRPRQILAIGIAGVTIGVLGLSGAVGSSAPSSVTLEVSSQSISQITAQTTEKGELIVPTSVRATEATNPAVAQTWTLMVGGDTLLTRTNVPSANPFLQQVPRLGDADLSMVNVETVISAATDKQSKEFNFRSPPRLAADMAAAGIDVGSLANNHSLDFGDQGLLDTIDALRDSGVQPVGAGKNLAEAIVPFSTNAGGVSVAVFGASQVIPDPLWIATDQRVGIASAGKQVIDDGTRRLLGAVQQAKATHDVVIVFMHWGKERQVCPTPVQIEAGRLLREAGAVAVLGSHPHVLQPIVSDATGVVAYSLGNFIWDPRSGITGDTGVLELTFLGADLSDITFHPHRLDGNGWAAPVSNAADRNRIMDQVQRNCTGANGASWK